MRVGGVAGDCVHAEGVRNRDGTTKCCLLVWDAGEPERAREEKDVGVARSEGVVDVLGL